MYFQSDIAAAAAASVNVNARSIRPRPSVLAPGDKRDGNDRRRQQDACMNLIYLKALARDSVALARSTPSFVSYLPRDLLLLVLSVRQKIKLTLSVKNTKNRIFFRTLINVIKNRACLWPQILKIPSFELYARFW